MNGFSGHFQFLTAVIGTLFWVGVVLIVVAKWIYDELDALEWIVRLAQGLTVGYAVGVVCLGVKYLFA